MAEAPFLPYRSMGAVEKKDRQNYKKLQYSYKKGEHAVCVPAQLIYRR
jgi:hypothetical protein